MKRLSIFLVILAVLLAACDVGALPGGGGPTVTDDAAPAPTGAASPITPAAGGDQPAEPPAGAPAAGAPAAGQPPAAAPTAAAPASGGVLPAPLLFLAPQEEVVQIWRLEVDGSGLRPLTAENTQVSDFDVSPADGRLAYVAGNDLLIANADGSNRSVLVDGPEAPPENDPQAALQILGKPRWSPDGGRIAYSLGGVNLVAAAGGAPVQILKSDPLPANPQEKPAGAPYIYWPESWSPDGTRLLLGYALYPESGGLAIIDPAGGTPLLIKSPESTACCNPVWAADSQSVYYASPYFGMFMAGLWRAGAADGAVQTLINGDPQDGSFHMPGFVHPAADGSLFFFYTKTEAFPEGQAKLTPVRATDPQAPTPLRSDTWLVGEALWAADGSGVVILDLESTAPGGAQMLGKLVYLKSDNSPAIPLAASGFALRWGR